MKRELCGHSSICTARRIPQALPSLGSAPLRPRSQGDKVLGKKIPQFASERTKPTCWRLWAGWGREQSPTSGSPEMQQGGDPGDSPAEHWQCQELLEGPEQGKPFAGQRKEGILLVWKELGSTDVYLLTISTDSVIGSERHYLHFLLVASLSCQPCLCLVRAEPFHVSCKSL